MKIQNIFFCPFHKITGLFCPGCGVTRMILSIVKGDFYQAFRYNPLLFILIPLFLFLVFNSILKYKFLKKEKQEKIYIFIIILLIIYGILRNIPYFSYLKPTKI